MRFLELPWLDFAIAAALDRIALGQPDSRTLSAARLGLVFTGIAFVFAFLAWLGFLRRRRSRIRQPLEPRALSLRPRGSGPGRAAAPPGACRGTAAFSDGPGHAADQDEEVLVFLVAGLGSHPAGDVQLQGLVAAGGPAGALHRAPLLRARNRGRPTRVYLLHMGLFVGLMVLGWAGVAASGRSDPPTWATVLAHGCHPRAVRHRARSLLGDRLVRAHLLRDRPPLRGTSGRGLRRGPAGLADRAGLGPPEHRSGLAGHGRLRRRNGGHPARLPALLRQLVPEPCLARAGGAGAPHRAVVDGLALPLVLGHSLTGRASV